MYRMLLIVLITGCGVDESGKATIAGQPVSSNGTPDAAPMGPKGDKGDKGDRGDAGVKGDKGDAGTAGTNGANGATGIQGERGAKGEATPSNQWFDPITKLWWLFGSAQSWSAASAISCGDTYHVPSTSESNLAVSHGLFLGANHAGAAQAFYTNVATIWSGGTVADWVQWFQGVVVMSPGTGFDSSVYGHVAVFCIANTP